MFEWLVWLKRYSNPLEKYKYLTGKFLHLKANESKSIHMKFYLNIYL